MNSDPAIKQKLELDHHECPPKNKKNRLWQKIKEFFIQEPEGEGSEYWRNRDLENW